MRRPGFQLKSHDTLPVCSKPWQPLDFGDCVPAAAISCEACDKPSRESCTWWPSDRPVVHVTCPRVTCPRPFVSGHLVCWLNSFLVSPRLKDWKWCLLDGSYLNPLRHETGKMRHHAMSVLKRCKKRKTCAGVCVDGGWGWVGAILPVIKLYSELCVTCCLLSNGELSLCRQVLWHWYSSSSCTGHLWQNSFEMPKRKRVLPVTQKYRNIRSHCSASCVTHQIMGSFWHLERYLIYGWDCRTFHNFFSEPVASCQWRSGNTDVKRTMEREASRY